MKIYIFNLNLKGDFSQNEDYLEDFHRVSFVVIE